MSWKSSTKQLSSRSRKRRNPPCNEAERSSGGAERYTEGMCACGQKIIGQRSASGSPRIDHRPVHVNRQRFDALGESLHRFRELSILPKHLHEEGRLVRRKRRPFLARAVQSLTMFRIGERMCSVAVGLAGLRQQYEWSRICRLQAEGEVEEDERINVERCKPQDIDENPHGNNDGLGDEKARRAKKTSERFSLQGKPVVAKN